MTVWQWIVCAVLAYLYGFVPWARHAHEDSRWFTFLLPLACGIIAAFYVFYGARYFAIW